MTELKDFLKKYGLDSNQINDIYSNLENFLKIRIIIP